MQRGPWTPSSRRNDQEGGTIMTIGRRHVPGARRPGSTGWGLLATGVIIALVLGMTPAAGLAKSMPAPVLPGDVRAHDNAAKVNAAINAHENRHFHPQAQHARQQAARVHPPPPEASNPFRPLPTITVGSAAAHTQPGAAPPRRADATSVTRHLPTPSVGSAAAL